MNKRIDENKAEGGHERTDELRKNNNPVSLENLWGVSQHFSYVFSLLLPPPVFFIFIHLSPSSFPSFVQSCLIIFQWLELRCISLGRLNIYINTNTHLAAEHLVVLHSLKNILRRLWSNHVTATLKRQFIWSIGVNGHHGLGQYVIKFYRTHEWIQKWEKVAVRHWVWRQNVFLFKDKVYQAL